MAKSKTPLIILAGIGAGFTAVVGLSALVGNACIRYALTPGKDGKTKRMREPDRIGGDLANGSVADRVKSVVERNRAALQLARTAWLSSIDVERVGIRSADGAVELVGFIYPAEISSEKWAFVVHGYTGDHTEVEFYAREYAARGYNVFAPDLRAQGESGGDLIGMGWTDRFDLIAWLRYLVDRFGEDIEIVMHGHSMGAAAICMASGEDVPSQVKAIVSDCAFTSVWDIFASQIGKLAGAALYPVMESARAMLKVRGSFDIRHASAVDQVRKSTTPTLFIHGASDGFVPLPMVHELFDACAAPEKRLLVVAGAGHVLSAQTDPKLYWSTVFDFLQGKTNGEGFLNRSLSRSIRMRDC